MPKNNQSSSVNLAELFGAVATNLMSQKDDLNKADTYNNDHGDNMVKTFETIASAVQKKQGNPPAEQLAFAGSSLRNSKSGSAQVYADGLMQASKQLSGQSAIDAGNVNVLLQSLLGGGVESQSTGGGDLLGSLLGGLAGEGGASQQTQPTGGGDMLGSLLGGLTGGGDEQSGDAGLDVGDLLNAGMAFMNAKQQGSNNVEAAIGALISASPLGQSEHRTQSGSVVANTILQVLGSVISAK